MVCSGTALLFFFLFKELIAVYAENRTEPINTLLGQNAELLIIKGGGRYSYYRAFKDYM
jgi:hypothetical protein